MIKAETGTYTGSGSTVSLSALNYSSSQVPGANRSMNPLAQLGGNDVTTSLPMGVQSAASPWIEILEQPKQADLRFRYKCEGRSAGSLLGASSTGDRKTYPSIRIHNFDGSNAIVVVSCVSTEPPHYPHPHNVVGNDCKDGVCTVKVKGTNVVSFSNIGIQCVTKKEIATSLAVRQSLQVNPFGTEPTSDAKVDLTSIRLCFQAFLPDSNRKFTRIVPPVVSQPIYDKKVVHNLTICRLSKQSGCANGGDEVFLLCEKINRDDIQVRFFEMAVDRDIVWADVAKFQPQDVHHQYAIVFQTPPYRDVNITSAVSVFIQLVRPSDDSSSDPKPFQYIPNDNDPFRIEAKKKRAINETFDRFPISALHRSTKADDEGGSSSSDEATPSTSVKHNLKKKVSARRTQQRTVGSGAEEGPAPSQNGQTASASVPVMPRYSYDDFGIPSEGLQFAAASVATNDVALDGSSSSSIFSSTPAAVMTSPATAMMTSAPVLFANDGRYYIMVTTGNGEQQITEVNLTDNMTS